MKFVTRFLGEEEAAITVDWVVLTAALMGISLAVLSTVETGLNSSAGSLSGAITTTVASATTT